MELQNTNVAPAFTPKQIQASARPAILNQLEFAAAGSSLSSSNPENAAHRLMNHTNLHRAVQRPFLFVDKDTPVGYSACLELAIEHSWPEHHGSGTFARFTPAGADLFV